MEDWRTVVRTGVLRRVLVPARPTQVRNGCRACSNGTGGITYARFGRFTESTRFARLSNVPGSGGNGRERAGQLSRRELMRSTVKAGLAASAAVWVAPQISSVALAQTTAGSPPPSTTTPSSTATTNATSTATTPPSTTRPSTTASPTPKMAPPMPKKAPPKPGAAPAPTPIQAQPTFTE
jgi:hypothetical protein